MTTQNLLRLLLLLMLMMRNVLTTVWCRFGRWSLVIKLSFCPDFEHKVSRFGQDFEVDAEVRFWSWSLGIILLLMLGCGYEVQSWSRFWSYVWSRFLSLSFVKILMFGWDFEVGAWSRFWICLIKICVRICDMTSRNYFGKQNSTLGSVVPLAMFWEKPLKFSNGCLWRF